MTIKSIFVNENVSLSEGVAVYNVPNTGGGSGQALGSAFSIREGEILTASSVLIGKQLTEVDLFLWKVGSPTGTATICIRKGSDDSIATTFGTIDVSTLATFITQYSFVNTANSYVLAANDKISVEYSGGDATNHVWVSQNQSNIFDGVNTCWAQYSTSWVNTTSRDLAGLFYTSGVSTKTTRQISEGGNKNAIQFGTAGSSRYVNVPYNSLLDNFTAFTISLWINRQGLPVSGWFPNIISKGWSAAGSFVVNDTSSNGQISFSAGGLGNAQVNITYVPTSNVWHHVVALYDGANIRLFVDNVESTRGPQPLTGTLTNASAVTIGGDGTNTLNNVIGVIDEVRIYNVALTTTEITALFSGVDIRRGLQAYFPFNEGSGTTTKDVVNGLTGTLTNGPSWYNASLPLLYSLTESITRKPIRQIAETLGLAEVVHGMHTLFEHIKLVDKVTRRAIRNINESIGLSEAVSRKMGRPVSETMTLPESIHLGSGTNKDIIETLTLAESVTRQVNRFRSVTETISLSDAVSRKVKRPLSETLSLSESILRRVKLRIAEVLNLLENLTVVGGRGVKHVVNISEALVLSNSPIMAYGGTGAASIGQPALLAAFGPYLMPGDNVSCDGNTGSTNNVATGKAYQYHPKITRVYSCSTNIIPNAAADAATGFSYIDFDLESGLCAGDISQGLGVSVQNACNAVHAQGMHLICDVASPYSDVSDITNMVSKLSAGDIFKLQASGQQTTASGFFNFCVPLIAAARAAGYPGMPVCVQVSTKAQNANQNATQAIACLATIVNLIDYMECFMDMNVQQSVTDAATVYAWWRQHRAETGSIRKAIRPTNETVALTEQLNRPSQANRFINEVLVLSEVVTRKVKRRATETLNLAEVSTGKKVHLIVMHIIESIALAEVIKRNPIRNIAQTLVLAETLLKRNAMRKVSQPFVLTELVKRRAKPHIAETLSLAESITRFSNHLRSVVETLSLSEAKTRKPIRPKSDSISLAEAVSPRLAIRRIPESITLTESILRNVIRKTIVETLHLAESINIFGHIKTILINETLALAEVVTRKPIRQIREGYNKFALQFSVASAQEIDIPYGVNEDNFTALTISCFISRTPSANPQIFISKGWPSPGSYQIYANTTGTIGWEVTDPNGTIANITTNMTDGVFHHVVGVYDGSQIRLYVDAVSQGSQALTGTLTLNSDVDVGSCDGYIDELRVYNVALTVAEITAVGKGVNITRGLVEWFPFDEGSGNFATDVVNGDTGTMINSPTWYAGNPTLPLLFQLKENVVITNIKRIAETLTLTEAARKRLPIPHIVESMALAETVRNKAIKPISESIHLAEAVVKQRVVIRTISEVLHLVETSIRRRRMLTIKEIIKLVEKCAPRVFPTTSSDEEADLSELPYDDYY